MVRSGKGAPKNRPRASTATMQVAMNNENDRRMFKEALDKRRQEHFFTN